MKDNLLANIKRGNNTYLFSTPDESIQFHANFQYLTRGWETLVDLENGTYGETGRTINELHADGLIKTKDLIKTGDYTVAGFDNRFTRKVFNETRINQVIKHFKTLGFNVTKEGLLHNYNAWLGDYKSGYRDEANNLFIFTPCGCNELSFNVTELDDEYFDWQESTYEW